MKHLIVFALLLTSMFNTSCGKNKTEGKKNIINSENKGIITTHGPQTITRNIIQDRTGNIWIAAFDGIFRYDGNSFTNITSNVTSARFFSVLEDSKENLWFGTIGAGVYYYDGKSFQNFTTTDGLLNNEVTSIYEDKKGNIWFGVSGGASCYDGKSFKNYIIDGNVMIEDFTGKTFQNRRPYEVNAILEDKKGKLWFATRGNTFVYDARKMDGEAKIFSVFTFDNKPFKNVRSIIEDKKGNIWLGGNDGLWRYNGSDFTNFTKTFVGYIYEDKKGNILTSSGGVSGGNDWRLSRYNEKSLSNKTVIEPEILKSDEINIFGVLEDNDGNIWFGTMDGVHRYDGKTITDFKSKENQK